MSFRLSKKSKELIEEYIKKLKLNPTEPFGRNANKVIETILGKPDESKPNEFNEIEPIDKKNIDKLRDEIRCECFYEGEDNYIYCLEKNPLKPQLIGRDNIYELRAKCMVCKGKTLSNVKPKKLSKEDAYKYALKEQWKRDIETGNLVYECGNRGQISDLSNIECPNFEEMIDINTCLGSEREGEMCKRLKPIYRSGVSLRVPYNWSLPPY